MGLVSTEELASSQRLTAEEAMHALQVLQSNYGFGDAVAWLEYPGIREFRQTPARSIARCPDCDGEPRATLGQYVYYSTLVRVRSCRDCGLHWSDAAIAPSILHAHFEVAYKDETYFEQRRAPVFDQMSSLAAQFTPRGGSVLDVGGGMGHLMARLRKARPDITPTVLDISSRSVDYARSHFGLDAVCGTTRTVRNERYDVVVCSDVIYYEEDLRDCWDNLSRITDTLIIRVPDKLWQIRLRQWLFDRTASPRARQLQDRLAGFNPEHRYILSRDYLRRRLNGMGYRVRFVPAVTQRPPGIVGACADLASRAARLFRFSPAMVVIARRSERAE